MPKFHCLSLSDESEREDSQLLRDLAQASRFIGRAYKSAKEQGDREFAAYLLHLQHSLHRPHYFPSNQEPVLPGIPNRLSHQ